MSDLFASRLEAERLRNIQLALQEDIGRGDVTVSLLPENALLEARVIVREDAVLCGRAWFDGVMHAFDTIEPVQWFFADGDTMPANATVCTLKGRARALLSAERCALNFLQMYSATATLTRQFVHATKGTACLVLDTRKTIPAHRFAQKYAVQMGGGSNQRLGLFDGILIKENHIAAAGGIAEVLRQAHGLATQYPEVTIQIEVETLPQLEEALNAGARLILLDNFDEESIRAAVRLTQNRAVLEVSGSVSLDQVARLAATGVNRISVGGLTKNIKAIDFSMRFVER